jgi:hypothetical protein
MKKHSLFKFLAIAALVAAPFVSGEALAKKPAPKEKPLRGVVHPKRVGGYSYKYLQGVDTRRFSDPSVGSQTVAGPFDSGFFFSSPALGRNGGDSPYMQ